MINTFKLKNGITVSCYEIPEMKALYLGGAVKSGSIFDTPEKMGCAHFMEHILVQAIPSFPNPEVLSEFIESLAGNYNASTSAESINFTASIPSTHLEDILKITSQVFFEPLFRQEDIQREKGAIQEEIRQYQDGTGYKLNKFWSEVRFKKGHPLLLDTAGLPETIDRMQKKDLVDFWERFFYPKNLYLTLVGNFQGKNIKPILEKIFGEFKSAEKFPEYPKLSNDDFSKKTVAIRQDQNLKACYIDLNFPSLSNKNSKSDLVNQAVVLYVLTGLRRSRLYRLLRQQRGLVYYVNSYPGIFSNFGYVDITSQAIAEKTDEVVSLIIKELKDIYTNGPLEGELEFAKNYYINQIQMAFDNPASIASWIGSALIYYGKVETPDEFCKMIAKVDVKSATKVMRDNWDFKKMNLTLQGLVDDSPEELKKYNQMLEAF